VVVDEGSDHSVLGAGTDVTSMADWRSIAAADWRPETALATVHAHTVQL